MTDVVVEKVSNEGAVLYCERRGSGPLLLLIAGGLGDAGVYAPTAEILADEYTVVTYDRRGNSRSTGDRTRAMSLAQQARDAVAIINAMGAEKASIFGNSGGGVIGLELAASHPEVIELLIVHEAPVVTVLPDADDWYRFAQDLDQRARSEGWEAAREAFFASIVSPNGEFSSTFPEDYAQRVEANMEFFFRHEYLTFTVYQPDLKRIKENNVALLMAAGRDSGDVYYTRPASIIAEQVGCKVAIFPGHHHAANDIPIEFSAKLRETLRSRPLVDQ